MKINEVIQRIRPTKNPRHVSTSAVPAQAKGELVRDLLIKKMLRQSNVVRPTAGDVALARDVVRLELKRADVEHAEEATAALKLQARQARRRHSGK
jgi:hypothetical protein